MKYIVRPPHYRSTRRSMNAGLDRAYREEMKRDIMDMFSAISLGQWDFAEQTIDRNIRALQHLLEVVKELREEERKYPIGSMKAKRKKVDILDRATRMVR